MLFGLRCRESAGCGGGMQPFAGTLSRQAWVESTCKKQGPRNERGP